MAARGFQVGFASAEEGSDPVIGEMPKPERRPFDPLIRLFRSSVGPLVTAEWCQMLLSIPNRATSIWAELGVGGAATAFIKRLKAEGAYAARRRYSTSVSVLWLCLAETR